MKRYALLSLVLCACFAQTLPFPPSMPGDRDEASKLPEGISQRDLIVKDDHKRNVEDSAQLLRLADELKKELEKGDKNVVSVKNIKQTEEIEKLARAIRARLKRY